MRYIRVPPLSYREWRLHLTDASRESVRYARNHMPILGAAAITCLIGYYFIWRYLYPDDYESLLVRSIGAAIALPVMFVAKLPKSLRSWLPLYWSFALTYVLPFVFGYMLAQNAAHAIAVGDTDIIWPLQNVVALVLFILLVNDGVLATVLWVVATIAIVAIVFLINTSPNLPELRRVYLDPMPLYGFILIIGSVAMRNREIIEQEKLHAVARVANNLAHELRTPLLGIRALAQGISSHLPTLIEAHDLVIKHGLPIEPVRRRHIERLRHGLEEIEIETNQSNSIIDRLLINASETPIEDHVFERFSAQQCVLKTLHRYPFTGRSERDLIKLELDRDFQIMAPPALVNHILFNLLRNSLFYVTKAGKGRITIQLMSSHRQRDHIIVHDTGTGIAPRYIRRIFERFFTTSESGQGAGIGLSYCRMVMEGLGGSIVCRSKFGAYTRFVLTFPRLAHD